MAFPPKTGPEAGRRHAKPLQREAGAANPLAAGGRPRVERAILTGISQSGRFVRDFMQENSVGAPSFKATRRRGSEHQIEEVGQRDRPG